VTTNDDSVARQLLQQAQTIAELRQEVERLVAEFAEPLADIYARLETIEDTAVGPSGSTTSWCWRYAGPAAREQLQNALGDWVAWIRHRYPLARRIPDCWTEHSEVVEELTALWLAWQAAYVEADAPLIAAAEWHDRWLPGVLFRLEHGAMALDCRQQHHERPPAMYADSQRLTPMEQELG
jgi:hypothetical protein